MSEQKIVLVEQEKIITALRDSGLDDDYILGLILAVMRGHIVNGTFTQEYLAAVEALAKQEEAPRIILTK